MAAWLRRFHSWLSPFRAAAIEPSRVIVGSTGSGKSEGELVDLVRLADRREQAIVLLDGHGPLAFAAAGHWAHRGHEARILYEPLDATDRTLCWHMLPQSAASDPARRALEDAETREEIAQCFMAGRNLGTLHDRPWTKEWLDAAIALCMAQPQPEPLSSLLSAFQVQSAAYDRLLHECRRPEVAAKFRDLERLKRKNEVQYDQLTGASRRLLEVVCASEVVRLRARPGPFHWTTALRERSLIAFDGGAIRTRELKRSLFLLASLAVIHAVRHSFAETRRPLRVVLVLEEAGALSLVSPFVLSALQELRKAGLATHLITQSSLDYGDPAVFQVLLGNAPYQAWYQCLSPADQELGAKALTNAAFDARAVQFTRTRSVQESATLTDPWRLHVREVIDPYYAPPSLQEQQFRKRLATLGVGERMVRTRDGVRWEQVRLLRPPSVPGGFEDYTRAVIARIRQRPLYLPPPVSPEVPSESVSPDAAERLRDFTG